MLDPDEYWQLVAVLALATPAAFWFLFRNLRRARRIEDAPTAKIRSAAQGLVELEGWGKAMNGYPTRSPLTGQTCLWWWYKITRGSGKSRRVIASGCSDGLFFFEDETGRCVVNPDGADVVTSTTRRWRGSSSSPMGGPETGTLFGSYQYTEKLLRIDSPLYALGWFETHGGGSYTAASIAEETARLLRRWKQDQHWLIGKFDQNRDGTVDMQEWETARREARRITEAAAANNAGAPDVDILMRPPDGRLFLLSDIPPQRLTRRFRRFAFLSALGFFAAGAGLVYLLQMGPP